MAEKFSNNAQSTLLAGIAAGDTTLQVASAALFPGSGNFRLVIDSEILLVTAVSGNTFTVSRGVEGTTAAAHNAGSLVTHVLTAAVAGNFAAKPEANTFTLGPQTIQTGADGNKGLIVQANSAGQSANLQEWQSSAGAVLDSIDPAGKLTLNKNNTGSTLSTANASLQLDNPAGQNQQMIFVFCVQGTVVGGVRGDSGGNFNWHCNTGAFHDFYASLDSSVVVCHMDSVGMIVGGDPGTSGYCQLHARVKDGGTTNIVTVFMVQHHDNGGLTPAAGFGVAIDWHLTDSARTEKTAALEVVQWASATAASSTGRWTISPYYASTAQEAIRAEAASGGVLLGFYGASAVAKQTVTGSKGGNAALASLITALANLGLITDSTT
jgi:hypothetical protein